MIEILQKLTSDEKFSIKKVSSGNSPLLTSENKLITYLYHILLGTGTNISSSTLKGSFF